MLFTFVVSCGSNSYTTQYRADSWETAKGALLNSGPFRKFVETAMPAVAGSPSGQPDVVLFAPMDPLTNCWVLQGGGAGEYFTSIVVGTSETELDAN
jgi:hypothetical protein